jgi:hypothetical protein
MTTKDLTDNELIARITETYNLTRYGGVRGAELVRRYREATTRLPGDTFRAGWDAARLECTSPECGVPECPESWR